MPQSKEVLSAIDEKYKAEVLNDYKIARISRETSLLGRKEVLGGKAKFGIFGDGKELAQIAMAKQFKNGDFRSGYYRDQTFMMAIDALTVQEYFAACELKKFIVEESKKLRDAKTEGWWYKAWTLHFKQFEHAIERRRIRPARLHHRNIVVIQVGRPGIAHLPPQRRVPGWHPNG